MKKITRKTCDCKQAILDFAKEVEERVIEVPLRTGDMMEGDEIIEDTISDEFVRANIRKALSDLVDEYMKEEK